jgi:hypothetical protein
MRIQAEFGLEGHGGYGGFSHSSHTWKIETRTEGENYPYPPVPSRRSSQRGDPAHACLHVPGLAECRARRDRRAFTRKHSRRCGMLRAARSGFPLYAADRVGDRTPLAGAGASLRRRSPESARYAPPALLGSGRRALP